MSHPCPTDPIDAVITWVDGSTAAHRRLRAQYMAQEALPPGENASNPHRWESSEEIIFCLRSIHTHAPMVRTIWIIVNHDAPDIATLPAPLRDKIRIVRHSEIFTGHTQALPTFNSLAIESVMWRIERLSERFLYFNDDVFLTAPLTPQDMFEGGAPVLRGEWRDYSALAADRAAQDDPALFNHFMQINAAALCGYGPAHLFAAAHVVHPMRRSIMAALYEAQRAAFERNINQRFRRIDQFLPQGAHNHLCILQGQAVFAQAKDHLHIKSGQGAGDAPEVMRTLLEQVAQGPVKFLCVNDLPQLEALVPEARALIAQVVAGV